MKIEIINFISLLPLGADVIGLNCCFDPQQLVEACIVMKKALKDAGYNKHIICQPIAYWTPDAGKDGYLGLPEYPFGKVHQILFALDFMIIIPGVFAILF